MNISSCNSYCFKVPNINFCSSRYGDNDTWPDNYTFFFRGFQQQITDVLREYSKLAQQGEKINVFSYGCSDGSEPYSIAIWLKEHCAPKVAEKFFPIKAYDCDDEIIDKAKSGNIYYSDYDKKQFNRFANCDISKYITLLSSKTKSELNPYYGKMSDKIRKLIEFEWKSYTDNEFFNCRNESVERINPNEKLPNNTILFIRNTMPYTDIYQYPDTTDDDSGFKTPIKFLKELYNRLGKNSVIILGGFDFNSEITTKCSKEKLIEALYEAGFEPFDKDSEYNYVWKKI